MVRNGLVAVVALAFTGIVLAIILPSIVSQSEGIRTVDAEAAGLTCTTPVGITTCSTTLPTEHEYTNTTRMTVTETNPGSVDRTATTTVGSDRVTLTITGLAANTVYTITVGYAEQAAGISNSLNGLLRVMPVLLLLGGFGVVVAAFVVVIRTFR